MKGAEEKPLTCCQDFHEQSGLFSQVTLCAPVSHTGSLLLTPADDHVMIRLHRTKPPSNTSQHHRAPGQRGSWPEGGTGGGVHYAALGLFVILLSMLDFCFLELLFSEIDAPAIIGPATGNHDRRIRH